MSAGPVFTYPEWRWEPRRTPSVQHLSLGADRYAENLEPMPKRRPVGFVQPPAVVEPALWEGDDA